MLSDPVDALQRIDQDLLCRGPRHGHRHQAAPSRRGEGAGGGPLAPRPNFAGAGGFYCALAALRGIVQSTEYIAEALQQADLFLQLLEVDGLGGDVDGDGAAVGNIHLAGEPQRERNAGAFLWRSG